MSKTATAVRPGVDILADGRRIDPDEAEKRERIVQKSPDIITNILNQVLDDAGVGIINQQFTIHTEGARDSDITFDRYYPKVKVLVKSFTRVYDANDPLTILAQDELKTEIARHKQYAEDHGYTFLPVIGGEVENADLQRVKVEVKGRAVA